MAYGVDGILVDVNPDVYDNHHAFEVDDTNMKLFVPIDMEGNSIEDLGNPVTDTDALNARYLFGNEFFKYNTQKATKNIELRYNLQSHRNITFDVYYDNKLFTTSESSFIQRITVAFANDKIKIHSITFTFPCGKGSFSFPVDTYTSGTMNYFINKQFTNNITKIEFITDGSPSIPYNKRYNGVLNEALIDIENVENLTVENTATLHKLVVNNSATINSDVNMTNHKMTNLANPDSDTDAVIYKMLRTKVKFVHATYNSGKHFLRLKFHSNNADFTFNSSRAEKFIKIKSLILGPYSPPIFSTSKFIIHHSSQNSTEYNVTMVKVKGENYYEIIPSTYPLIPAYKKIYALNIQISKAPNPTTIDGYIFHDIIY